MMPRLSLPLLFFVLVGSAAAQTDRQVWLQSVFSTRLSGGTRFFGEIQSRDGENRRSSDQFILRAAFGRDLGREFTLWAGYAWTPNIEPDFRSEDRYFLQGSATTRLGPFTIGNRTRLEARNIHDAFGTSVRLRHQLRASAPTRPGSSLSGIVWNEYFYNLNSTPNGPRPGFDQNRLFLGLGIPATSRTRYEIGYQRVDARAGRHLDTILASLFVSF